MKVYLIFSGSGWTEGFEGKCFSTRKKAETYIQKQSFAKGSFIGNEYQWISKTGQKTIPITEYNIRECEVE